MSNDNNNFVIEIYITYKFIVYSNWIKFNVFNLVAPLL